MKASQIALDMARDHIGYVYVFDKKNFKPRNGNEKDAEWRSEKNEIPIKVVTVKANDLPKNIDIIPPQPDET